MALFYGDDTSYTVTSFGLPGVDPGLHQLLVAE